MPANPPRRNPELVLVRGSSATVASASPVMLARLIRASMDGGFYEKVEAILRRHPRTVALPGAVLQELRGTVGGSRKAAAASSVGRTSVVGLARLTRSAIRKGEYNAFLQVLKKHRGEVPVGLPIPVANGIKRLLSTRLQREEISGVGLRPVRTIIFSNCKISGAKRGKCTVGGGVPQGGMTQDECEARAKNHGESYEWVPE